MLMKRLTLSCSRKKKAALYITGITYECNFLLKLFPVYGLRQQQSVDHVFETLLPVWDTQVKLLAPGFALAQHCSSHLGSKVVDGSSSLSQNTHTRARAHTHHSVNLTFKKKFFLEKLC